MSLNPLKLTALLLTLAFAVPSQAALIAITSDPDDGQISQLSHGAGAFEAPLTTGGSLVVGGAGTARSRTSIMFFELPSPGILNSASFSIVVDLNDLGSASQRADLWGIGFQADTTILDAWALEANTDAGAIGGGVGVANRIKIQDNFIVSSIAPISNATLASPVTVTTDVTGSANLTAYIQSLYDAGAEAGDFAVFRINADFDIMANNRWRFFSGDASSNQPLLLLDFVPPPVPEPATSALLALAGIPALIIRRRHRSERQSRSSLE